LTRITNPSTRLPRNGRRRKCPSRRCPPRRREAIEAEIADLDSFTALATSITLNKKGEALFKALDKAFATARQIGAAEKAIIFTESKRTQNYLCRLLQDSPYANGIVFFNGTNTDDSSKAIYAEWLERHKGTDKVTGSRTADMRSALVDYFREKGRIMIATEAGAEGINLQFCSLVVNYDLPWNPQRIEQRIGRCHRYGQKHDVVVVNFLNRNNQADKRVFELLSEKFKLFEGVFGASDEVLGAIGSGVDFEKRISGIYQSCRKPDEIKSAFDQLQLELGSEIDEAMTDTRKKLLENFDDEVREKLRMRQKDAEASLNRFERMLMRLTEHELADVADFDGESSFVLKSAPLGGNFPLGRYELPRRSGEAHFYRMEHPLASAIVERAKGRNLPPAELHFHYDDHAGKVSVLEPLVGKSGWLTLSQFTVEALDQAEDHLVFAAATEDGTPIDEEVARKLFRLSAKTSPLAGQMPNEVRQRLDAQAKDKETAIQREVSNRNARYFESEADKLDGWAEDLKMGLEQEIKDIDRQIRETRRQSVAALTLEEKLVCQKQIKSLESQRKDKRRSLFDAQDRIDAQREALIREIEGKMRQKIIDTKIITIFWNLS
jgi:adenine-specific DNA-methyltransferase